MNDQKINKLAILVAIALCVAGIADIVLKCVAIGIKAGLLSAAHDPGKDFFHVFLLPVSGYVLIRYFLKSVWLKMWETRRLLFLALVILQVLICSWYSLSDQKTGFYVRLAMPYDVNGRENSMLLQNVRDRLWTKTVSLRQEIVANTQATATEKSANLIRISVAASDEYRKELNHILDTNRTFSSFIKETSPRAKWASVLTILGVLMAGSILWIFLFQSLSREKLTTEMREALLIISALMTPWLALRAYSEWHINFGLLDVNIFQPFFPAAVLTIAVAFLIFFLRTSRIRLTITSAAIAGTSTLFSMFAGLHFELFDSISHFFAHLDSLNLAIIYLIVLVAGFVTIRHTIRIT